MIEDHDREAGLQRAAEAAVLGRARRREAETEQQDREREQDVDRRGRSPVSTQPRKKPAIMPIVTPISTDRPVPTNATMQRHAGAVEDAREDVAPDARRRRTRCSLTRAGRAARSRPARRSTARSGPGCPRMLADRRREDRDEDQQDDERQRRRAQPCPCGSGARTAAAATAPPPAPFRRRSRRRRGPRRAADRWRLFQYSNR